MSTTNENAKPDVTTLNLSVWGWIKYLVIRLVQMTIRGVDSADNALIMVNNVTAAGAGKSEEFRKSVETSTLKASYENEQKLAEVVLQIENARKAQEGAPEPKPAKAKKSKAKKGAKKSKKSKSKSK